MISIAQALQLVLERTAPLSPQAISLDDGLGLVLAEDAISGVESPPHDKSLVDGYAVQTEDIRRGVREFLIGEEIVAGQVSRQSLSAGTAASIMTGAPLPENADAVVMREQTRPGRSPRTVCVLSENVQLEQNILRRAAVLRRGERLLAGGLRLRPADLGLLAETGHATLQMIPRPQVAVVATGNELVPPQENPGPGQIRNSNGPMLTALIRNAGAVPRGLGIARDDPEQLSALVQEGLEANMLLLSGGVSAGVLDLVPRVLQELRVTEVFHKVDVKPGKPLWFGVAKQGTLVFGLPGNPVSVFVGFHVFVRPALDRLAGRDAGESLRELPLGHDFSSRSDRPTFHPAAVVRTGSGAPCITLLSWKGSSDLRALTCATMLARIPAGDHVFRRGESIACLSLERWSCLT